MFDTCLALLDPVIRKEPCLVSKAHEEHLTRLFYMVWLRSNKVGVECYPCQMWFLRLVCMMTAHIVRQALRAAPQGFKMMPHC